MSLMLSPPREGGFLRTARTVVIVILAAGCGTGLLLNRTTADNRRLLLEQQRLLSAAEPIAALPPSEPVMAPEMAGGRRVLFSLRPGDVTPPPNPFEAQPLPTQAPPTAGRPAALRTPGPLPAGSGVMVEVVPAAPGAKPAPAVAPSVDDLHLTGVVQGDPPLAVVQFQGQSLFLKIGDQVADSWRLMEIKERSAVFQMGARRVEVPIKGGSSE